MDNLFSDYPNLWVNKWGQKAELMNPNQYLPLLERYWGNNVTPKLIEMMKSGISIYTPEYKFSFK